MGRNTTGPPHAAPGELRTLHMIVLQTPATVTSLLCSLHYV